MNDETSAPTLGRHRRFGAFGFALIAGLAAVMMAWRTQAVAGVAPEVSRVVFSEGAHEQSLHVFNVNKYPVLVQTWIDDGNILALPQDSKAPIVALPPIFRMDPGDQMSVRLINSGAKLPEDRESLFWLNLYEIPATQKIAAPDSEKVTVTMRTQIKVFVRPEKLPFPETDLPKHLTFALVHRPNKVTLEIGNPTPYYATIGALQITIEGAPRPETVDMIAPFSHADVDLGGLVGTPGEHAKVLFTLLNDEGNPMLGERELAVRNAGKSPPQ
ncbi:fimbrial biogenesis chaperone [Paraburkholderia adhaesiva]|uniref:fimbrial biogenesis chaperone n=1 Tax=Paraburkholderia adhaesiva TaxID=2883244 RepID=UPI001F3B545E|nr:molecular chaperone [Paraburkholderia adhaesiva]